MKERKACPIRVETEYRAITIRAAFRGCADQEIARQNQCAKKHRSVAVCIIRINDPGIVCGLRSKAMYCFETLSVCAQGKHSPRSVGATLAGGAEQGSARKNHTSPRRASVIKVVEKGVQVRKG